MNQGVSFLVADMATRSRRRLLTWQAAWMIDRGLGRKATRVLGAFRSCSPPTRR